MSVPKWVWLWAWNGFRKWSLLEGFRDNLTAQERWEVVIWSLWPGIKHSYLRPAEEWLHRHLPTAALLLCLQRCGSGWYRVPSTAAAIHLWRRLGVHVLEDDFVRIEGGVVTMKGYADDDLQLCEFWRIEDD